MRHIYNFCTLLFICLVLTNAVTAMINGFVMISVAHIGFLVIMHVADNIKMYYPIENE